MIVEFDDLKSYATKPEYKVKIINTVVDFIKGSGIGKYNPTKALIM